MLETVISLIFLGIAAYWDAKTKKVPYRYANVALIASLIYCIFIRKPDLVPISLYVVGMFILGAMRVSGWGDIKCLMCLGLVSGWKLALASYIAAQFLLVGYRLITAPAETVRQIKCVYEGDGDAESEEKEKRRFALMPFIFVSYAILALARHTLFTGG